MTHEQLMRLTIPERDAHLFDTYEKTFGSSLRGFSTCPRCKEHMEFEVSTKDLFPGYRERFFPEECFVDLTDQQLHLRFRLPNSLDLASIARSKDIMIARSALVARCVTDAVCDGQPFSQEKLTPEIIERIEEHISGCEPDAEILLDLKCTVCGYQQQIPFDILVFLWKEISSQARQLLYETHIIASAYGWREEDILSLSPARRRYYLEMVS